jgi:uncharacterized membrane protein (DUF4010 family)
MAGGAAAGLLASLRLWLRTRRPGGGGPAVVVSNPFELGRALQFALLFAVVLLGVRAGSHYLGTAGTYAAGLLAGSTDVDAITLSMARLAGGPVAREVAATTIFLGATSNTVVKGVMAAVLGGAPFRRRVAPALAAMLVAGALGMALTWLGR